MNYAACGYKNYTKWDMECVARYVAEAEGFFLVDVWYSVKHKMFIMKYNSVGEIVEARLHPDYFDLMYHRLKNM